MARKGKNRGKVKPKRKADVAREDAASTDDGATKRKKVGKSAKSERKAEDPGPHRREIRPFLYAGVDAIMAVVYVAILSAGLTSQHESSQTMLWSLVLLVLVMGACMLVRNKWSWRVAVGTCAAMLVMAVVLLVLILMSAAFLSGVYGAFGKAASSFALVAAALIIELIALLPAFQLKYLLTRAGRRSFGLEPLWK